LCRHRLRTHQHTADCAEEFIYLEWLPQKILSQFQRHSWREILGRIAADEEDGKCGLLFPKTHGQLIAKQTWHEYVRHHQINLVALKTVEPQGLVATLGCNHFKLRLLQTSPDELAYQFVVIHQ